jgi:predicted TIM-barrel fold metal-dependent hydrolase
MIIDVHTHVGEIAAFNGLDLSVGSMLTLMDTVGIDICMQMPALGIAGCFREAFEISEAAYELSNGKLIYSLIYDPHYIKASMEWFQKALDRPGFVGIKIHPSFHQVWPEDPRYEPIWKFAAENDLPILTHSWAVSDYNPVQKFSTPDCFAQCVERFPQVNLILGHAGGRYEGHLAAADLAKQYPNVHMDTSGDCYSFGFIEWMVGQVGADRILFGSDMNWIDPRTHLARIYDADITLEEKRSILGDNACRLYKLAV